LLLWRIVEQVAGVGDYTEGSCLPFEG
jgi:hypothetical protein